MTKTVIHAALREKGDVFKLIAFKNNELKVHYCNQGSALLLCFFYTHDKARLGIKKLSSTEREQYFAEVEPNFIGDGI